MYKTSNDMKDEIEQICYNLELGSIDWKEASKQLFALYGVSHQRELLKAYTKWLNDKVRDGDELDELIDDYFSSL